MGVPCDEILGNHSKGLPGCFYTLWATSRRWSKADHHLTAAGRFIGSLNEIRGLGFLSVAKRQISKAECRGV